MERKKFFDRLEDEVKSHFDTKQKVCDFESDYRFHNKPCMYNLYLFENSEIPINIYIKIFENFFHLESDRLIVYFNKLHSEGYICHGLYTKEIAESKVKCIEELVLKSGHSIKCLISKDNNYAIEKS